jgi:hypothetical protein
MKGTAYWEASSWQGQGRAKDGVGREKAGHGTIQVNDTYSSGGLPVDRQTEFRLGEQRELAGWLTARRW